MLPPRLCQSSLQGKGQVLITAAAQNILSEWIGRCSFKENPLLLKDRSLPRDRHLENHARCWVEWGQQRCCQAQRGYQSLPDSATLSQEVFVGSKAASCVWAVAASISHFEYSRPAFSHRLSFWVGRKEMHLHFLLLRSDSGGSYHAYSFSSGFISVFNHAWGTHLLDSSGSQ